MSPAARLFGVAFSGSGTRYYEPAASNPCAGDIGRLPEVNVGSNDTVPKRSGYSDGNGAQMDVGSDA